MNRIKLIWLAGAFLAGLLATGIPYWQLSDADLSLPHAALVPGLLVIALGVGLLVKLQKSSSTQSLLVGFAVPCMVLARVVVDVMRDASSHNLWPVEIAIALILGLGAAACGALIGNFFVRRAAKV